MTAGSMVTIASLRPPMRIQNVSPKISLYRDKTCTGLRAMARESAKQRSRETTGTGTGIDELKSVFIPQLLQQYQMMLDCHGHGGVLAIGNPKLFGSLLHDPSQRSIVVMTHERTQVVDDVMIEAAREPTYKRVFRRIIGRCREDVVHAVFKLATIRGKVGAVDGVCRSEEHTSELQSLR